MLEDSVKIDSKISMNNGYKAASKYGKEKHELLTVVGRLYLRFLVRD